MNISALVRSSPVANEVTVSTGGTAQRLSVPAKASGPSSFVNGGEFLMLALATCYCNDLYREGRRLGIAIKSVEAEASATFAGVGLAATNITYRAELSAPAPAEIISELLRQTDAVAEVHNTIRTGSSVELLAPKK